MMGLLDSLLSSDKQREPAECIIKVDGAEITKFYPYAKELTVSMSRKAATTCTIVFDTMRDESGSWLIQDSNAFQPWMEIEIIAAFGSSHDEQIMHGYIKEVRAELPQDMSAASVTVTAQDDSILLNREQGQGSLSNEEVPLPDGEVVRQLVGTLLEVDVDAGMTTGNLNRNSSPVQLIRERAEANGFEFYVRDKKLYFKALQLGGQAQQPAIMLYAGKATNCLSFSARYDGHLPDQVRITRAAESGSANEEEIISPDLPLLGDAIANSESRGLTPFVWDMQSSSSKWEETRVQAKAKANENAWKVIAEGELDGSLYGQVLLTHKTVFVDGVGEFDGGIYYVDEVTHRFSVDGYRQKFKLIRNATGEIIEVRG